MRTEQEILKDFKKLGYVIDNDENQCDMEHKCNKKNILINKNLKLFACCKWALKPYETTINGTKMETNYFNSAEPSVLFVEEFELLYALFKCWGWIGR